MIEECLIYNRFCFITEFIGIFWYPTILETFSTNYFFKVHLTTITILFQLKVADNMGAVEEETLQVDNNPI